MGACTASRSADSNMTRASRSGVDLRDPVYAAEVFEAFLRQDVVDARVALDILERRGQVDMSTRRVRRLRLQRDGRRNPRNRRRPDRRLRARVWLPGAEQVLRPGARSAGERRRVRRERRPLTPVRTLKHADAPDPAPERAARPADHGRGLTRNWSTLRTERRSNGTSPIKRVLEAERGSRPVVEPAAACLLRS